jgi:hypothetical protein
MIAKATEIPSAAIIGITPPSFETLPATLGLDTGVDAGAGAGAGAGTGAEVGAGPGVGVEPGVNAGPEVGAGVGVEFQTRIIKFHSFKKLTRIAYAEVYRCSHISIISGYTIDSKATSNITGIITCTYQIRAAHLWWAHRGA